ncbi:putative 2og-fe oxygenase [Phaeomoniella chlamydospora]|uniref:Putative 2og-fe oxygenase n=1 Tax=Phaeomoniella chlamydospora TaxID=158046 RepID=A0A0G2FP52_PHACM|nr:putative 2og-fe oxygenase [Phaeomoniella chlamydospora]
MGSISPSPSASTFTSIPLIDLSLASSQTAKPHLLSQLREQFEFATELPERWTEGSGLPLYERLKGPNQWPKSDPKFRDVIEGYIDELTHLGERFLELVAEALGLPPDIFFSFLSEQHRLKVVHYPLSSDEGGSVQGVGPHKDSSGWWTFLLQASPDTSGLEALNKSNEWVAVPPIPGTFVVNIGQAFEVVTHGICKATTHRVVSGQNERYSVPFFQGVRGSLTKQEALGVLQEWARTFDSEVDVVRTEGDEGRNIDSAFLKGRDVGKRFYGNVYEKFVKDDA